MSSIGSEKKMGKIEKQKKVEELEKKKAEEERTKGITGVGGMEFHINKMHKKKKKEENTVKDTKNSYTKGVSSSGAVEKHHIKMGNLKKKEMEQKAKANELITKGVSSTNAMELHMSKMKKLEEEELKQKKDAKQNISKMTKGDGQKSRWLEERMKMKKEEKLGPKIDEEAIKEKWNTLQKGTEEENIICVGYDEEKKLVLKRYGKGRPSEFLEENEPMFCAVRMKGTYDGKRGEEQKDVKLFFILWMPKKTPKLTETKMYYHKKRKFERIFRKYNFFFQYNDKDSDDFQEAMLKLEKKMKEKVEGAQLTFKKVEWNFE